LLFKIAIKNLLGARLRTFLNVLVTAFSFFLILFISAMYNGMLEHAKQVTMDTEIAGGAYWHPEYDPLDPMTFENAHSALPGDVQSLVDQKKAFPVLVSQASIYPGGRIMPAIMKGIPPGQNIVNMPTDALSGHDDIAIPVLIGKGMASDTKLNVGDSFTIRWLDTDRTYDADEGIVVHIMDTENFKLDMSHIWIPLKKAQTMLAMEGEATYVTYEKGLPPVQDKGD
jgi:ABC-type lipoprotein release transport system permease subunit